MFELITNTSPLVIAAIAFVLGIIWGVQSVNDAYKHSSSSEGLSHLGPLFGAGINFLFGVAFTFSLLFGMNALGTSILAFLAALNWGCLVGNLTNSKIRGDRDNRERAEWRARREKERDEEHARQLAEEQAAKEASDSEQPQ